MLFCVQHCRTIAIYMTLRQQAWILLPEAVLLLKQHHYNPPTKPTTTKAWANVRTTFKRNGILFFLEWCA